MDRSSMEYKGSMKSRHLKIPAYCASVSCLIVLPPNFVTSGIRARLRVCGRSRWRCNRASIMIDGAWEQCKGKSNRWSRTLQVGGLNHSMGCSW
ncbi:hypothetical protein BRADI_1g36725v3 [Brachypodium distachyon]|uniref:Uncharacterized protein n=1 Tax=Brachypodium distachyon TaxID=15368 RepID=A0A2K2DN34_BRADI|nr:hypothetical protein BRADI_1g36725v3 [Brachypodium distachyon]